MTGSEWSALGVAISFVGAMFAWYGTRVSGQENKQRGEEHLALTRKALIATEKLEEKSSELADVQRKLATSQDALVTRTDENAALNKRFAAYAMGTGSFFYLHLFKFGQDGQEAILIHVGENPVKDTQVIAHDVTSQLPEIAAGRAHSFKVVGSERRDTRVEVSYAGQYNSLTKYLFESNPTGENYFYLVRFHGGSGNYKQLLNVAKVGDEWKQAYRIERLLDDVRTEPVGQYFDESFPIGPTYLARAPGLPDLPLKGVLAKIGTPK